MHRNKKNCKGMQTYRLKIFLECLTFKFPVQHFLINFENIELEKLFKENEITQILRPPSQKALTLTIFYYIELLHLG